MRNYARFAHFGPKQAFTVLKFVYNIETEQSFISS